MTDKRAIQEIIAGWANNPSSVTELNLAEYETISETYNRHLIDVLGYRTWFEFHDYAGKFMSKDASILDVCCGTGLVGNFLRNNGYRYIDGVDINPSMLKIAESTKSYDNLFTHDMNESLPLTKEYGTVVCIGSLTYFNDFRVIENMIKLTQTGGHIVFSHRDDMFESQGYGRYLENNGDIEVALISDSIAYLPNDVNYGDRIRVKIVVVKKCSQWRG